MSFAVDANLLVYASDRDSPVHERAVAFLRTCVEGTEMFCLAWVTVFAYLRIVTHPAVFRRPLSPDEAMDNMDSLLGLPHVQVFGEDDRFGRRCRDTAHGISTLHTRDRDFLRFDFLSVIDPLETAVRNRPARRRRASMARA